MIFILKKMWLYKESMNKFIGVSYLLFNDIIHVYKCHIKSMYFVFQRKRVTLLFFFLNFKVIN